MALLADGRKARQFETSSETNNYFVQLVHIFRDDVLLVHFFLSEFSIPRTILINIITSTSTKFADSDVCMGVTQVSMYHSIITIDVVNRTFGS